MFPCVKINHDDYGEYVNALVNDLQTAHNVARSTLNTSLKRMKNIYDLKILLRPYDKGGVVYILDTTTIKCKSKELLSPWKGPAIIID